MERLIRFTFEVKQYYNCFITKASWTKMIITMAAKIVGHWKGAAGKIILDYSLRQISPAGQPLTLTHYNLLWVVGALIAVKYATNGRVNLPFCPACKLRTGEMRFQANQLNNWDCLTSQIESPWILVPVSLLEFDVNVEIENFIVFRSEDRLTFLAC